MKLLIIHPGQVSQTDLENLMTLDAQIERLRENRDMIASTALQRIPT